MWDGSPGIRTGIGSFYFFGYTALSTTYDPHPEEAVLTDMWWCLCHCSNGGPQQNPFGEDDWEEQEQIDESKGVPVRALYDYVGQEEDELTFKAGQSKLAAHSNSCHGYTTFIYQQTLT